MEIDGLLKGGFCPRQRYMNIGSYAKIQNAIKTYLNDTHTIEFFIVDKEKKKPWEIH